MNTKLTASLVAGLILGFAFGSFASYPQAKANPNKAEGWEYRTVLFSRANAEFSNAENKLNALGKDGWECAGPVYADVPVIAFKRPRK